MLNTAPLADTLQDPVPFLITSCGQAGSLWLGSSLHMHPHILCSAGVDHPLDSLNYEYNAEEVVCIRASIKNASDMHFGVTPALRETLASNNKVFGRCVASAAGREYKEFFIPLEGMPGRKSPTAPYILGELTFLPKLKDHKAFGNVHGVIAQGYANEIKKGTTAFSGYGDKVIALELIRHPITRLDSYFNHLLAGYKANPSSAVLKKIVEVDLPKHVDAMRAFEDLYHIDCSQPENFIFFWGERIIGRSKAWATHAMAAPHMPRILFEKLRSDREYFRQLVHTITKGTVEADDEYLDKVFSPENLAGGRISASGARKDRRDPKTVYESWPLWQQKEVARIFKENHLFKVYEPFGYDLSFLPII